MGGEQPFLYEAAKRNDGRFPSEDFDPKAVTRASLMAASTKKQKQKQKQEGPFLSFNRHPEYVSSRRLLTLCEHAKRRRAIC
jgi:hypothetical protein